jgi:hypothetical protein
MFDYGASMYTDIVIGLILAASVDDGEAFFPARLFENRIANSIANSQTASSPKSKAK